MLDAWRHRKIAANNRAPVVKSGRLAKVHGMVFQRFPENLQNIALWVFNAMIDFVAAKPLSLRDDGGNATRNRLVKSGLLAGMNADVDEFKNHEVSWSLWGCVPQIVDREPQHDCVSSSLMSLFTSLRYLVALHEQKHFGRAADACHITQPALSNAIRALEEEFGTAIVKRGRTFQSFTPEGEQIFITVQRVLHEQELLRQALQSAADQPVGALRLGAVPTVMPIAARFAGMLQKRCPGMVITVLSLSSPEIEAGLENLSLDLALGYTGRLSARAARISTLAQYTERYFLLRRAAKPAKSSLRILHRPVSWKAASVLPLCLLTPDMHNRAIVSAAFSEAGSSVKAAIETNSILTLSLTVQVGEVSSILPGALVSVLHGYPELEAVPLVAPEVLTPIGFMFVSGGRPSHTLRAALDMAVDPTWLQHVSTHSGLLKALPAKSETLCP